MATADGQMSVTQRLPFSWDRVCLAFWRRYPNPYAKHVVAEDVLERRVVDGRLHTRRLLVKQRAPGVVPWYVQSLAGMSEYIVEDSVIDPLERSIVTTTRNIGLLTRLGVFTETVQYRPCGEETQVLKTVRIHPTLRVSAWLQRKATNFFISNYAKRIEDTNKGFLHVLGQMFPPSLVERARDRCKAGQVLARSAGQSLRERLASSGSLAASLTAQLKSLKRRQQQRRPPSTSSASCCLCVVCSRASSRPSTAAATAVSAAAAAAATNDKA